MKSYYLGQTDQELTPEVLAARQYRQSEPWQRGEALWGTTTGCFTTMNQPVAASPNVAMEVLQGSSQVQNYLTQDEVNTITTAKNQAVDDLTDLQNYARKVLDQWSTARTKTDTWMACNVFCSKEESAMNEAIDSGNQMLTELGNRRYQAFRKLDMLMAYAPSADIAQQLCLKKQQAFQKHTEAVNQIGQIASAVHAQIAAERGRTAGLIESLLAILQAFMDIIRALIAIIMEAFKGIAASAAFIARNPKLFLYGGIALGILVFLGVLGFAFRPYLKLFF